MVRKLWDRWGLSLVVVLGGTVFIGLMISIDRSDSDAKHRKAQEKSDFAGKTANEIRYFKDYRAGLCFAALVSTTGSKYGEPFASVPCHAVEPLLDNPLPP